MDDIRIGIVGCSEGTHGKVWAEMISQPGGRTFGMRPTRVWDADPGAADLVARTAHATPVRDPGEVDNGVDGIWITELHPDRYLALARPYLQRGMRLFFNRPFAGSTADAREIIRLAQVHGARIYSASALYHTAVLPRARDQVSKLGGVRLFNVTGPTDHLTFYLPHAIACMTSVLGAGAQTVRAIQLTEDPSDANKSTTPVLATVQFSADSSVGAAVGTLQMVGPGASWYGFRLKAFGPNGETEDIHFDVGYELLLEKMSAFFRTGEEPIPPATILEKTAIYYGIRESARLHGRPVDIAGRKR